MAVHVLLATQRTGTGAFGSLIDQHPDIVYKGEIFHTNSEYRDEDVNYFNFLLDRVTADPLRAMPDAGEKNFSEYWAFLNERTAAHPNYFVDVKYDSTHHFNGGWQMPFDIPKFLLYTMREQVKFVHLKRENLIKTYVSGRLAEANKVWHTNDSGKISVQKVTLRKHAVLNYLDSMSLTIRKFDEFFRGYPNIVVVTYEKLFPSDGSVNAAEIGKVAKLLGIDEPSLAELKPFFIKQTKGELIDVIENFDEISEHLADTPYAQMLKS